MSSLETYSISDDFSNATEVNLAQLHSEVAADVSVSLDPDRVDQRGSDTVQIYFPSALSAPQKSALDALVAAYTYSVPTLNQTQADIDAHVADSTVHRSINDSGSSATDVWSGQKISSELGGKSAVGHAHSASDVTSGTFADARVSASSVTQHQGAIDHDSLANYSANEHLDWTADQGASNIHANNVPVGAVTQHEGSIGHQNLSGAGTNTHAQIDAHLASAANPHAVTKAQVGLGDVPNLKCNLGAAAAPVATDDSAAGYSVGSTWLDTVADKAYCCLDASAGSAVWVETTQQNVDTTDHTSLTNVGTNTHAQIDAHLADAGKHREINDAGSSPTELWSASQISAQLATKSGSGHGHVAADVSDFSAAADARIALQRGAADGLASLDGGGKVPASQLSLSNVVYQGAWNASANSPALADGTGTQGHYYVVSVPGTTSLDGVSEWQVGDWAIFNGTVWEKADHTDSVTSVAGKQGVVVLDAGDVASGTFADARISQASVTQHQAAIDHDSLANYVANEHLDWTADLGATNLHAGNVTAAAVTQHEGSISHQNLSGAGTNSHAQLDAHVADSGKHREINDSGTSASELWSASKISGDLAGKSATGHTHDSADVTSGTFADGRISETSVTQHVAALAHQSLSGAGSTTHAQLDSHVASSANPHSVTKAQVGLANVADTKVKLDAAVAPGATDDSGAGYSVGSLWVDVSGDRAYVCVDSTAAAAVWVETTQQNFDTTDHTLLSNVGSNTHAQIDSHLADSGKHREINDAGTSTTELWSASKISGDLAGKSATGHAHAASDVTSGTFASARISEASVTQHVGALAHQSLSGAGTNTHAQIDSHVADAAKHREINDAGTSATELWSASKISGDLAGKSATGHAHAASDVTSGTFASARISEASVTQHVGALAHQSLSGAGTNTHAQIDTHVADGSKHRVINDAGTSATELWSASKISGDLAGKAATGHGHVAADVSDFSAAADARIALQRGAADGLASLDGGGKVPASQLSLSNVVYQGSWNASTNSPALTSSVGTQGHYYVVGTAGSTSVDSVADWGVGDWIIFNGSVWEKADHSDSVTSVAGKQGAVTLVMADVTDAGDAATRSTGAVSGNVAKVGPAGLGNSEVVVTNGAGNLESAAQATGFNKAFGTTAGTVSEGNHAHANYIDSSEKGAASGVASLTASSKVPSTQVQQANSYLEVEHDSVADSNLILDPNGRNGAAGASISKPGASGFIHLMPNSSNVQWIAGDPGSANGVNNFYLDVDNQGALLLNTLGGAGAGGDVVATDGATLRPDADGTSDLGSVTKRWQNVYGVTLHGDGSNVTGLAKAQVGLTNVQDTKVKLDATAAPGATDDSGAGYSVGSLWVDATADKAYVCLDSTATAAVWTETTQQNSDTTDHTLLSNVGTNTHAQIDTHIADASKHREINDAGTLATELWSAAKISGDLAGKSATGHVHAASDVTSGTFASARISEASVTQHVGALAHQSLSGAGTNTHAQIDSHVADSAKHREINDAGTSATELWSASKISGDLAGKSATGHAHSASDVTSGTFANARISEASVTQHVGALAHQSLSGAGVNTHAQIDTHMDSAVLGPGTATDNFVPRFDGATGKLLQGPTAGSVSYDDSSALSVTGSKSGYMLDVANTLATGGGNGFRIMAGEVAGDVAFHIADQNDTFQIMEMEADQGYVTLGKTYAQTLTDNGTVYGLDIQHTGSAKDFNTQAGVYRIGGTDVVDVAQTLTNKTITAASNSVRASELATTGASVVTTSAAPPSAGQVLTATGSTAANWQTPSASSVFGSEFYQQASDGQSSTTSQTLQTKVTLTTGSLPTGTYRLGYTLEVSNGSNGVLTEVEVRLDGTVVALPTMEADNDFLLWGGFAYQSLSGVVSATLKHRVQTSGTSKVRRARLELWRVS